MRRSTLVFAAVALAVLSCNAQQGGKIAPSVHTLPSSPVSGDRVGLSNRKPPATQPALGAPVQLPGPTIVPSGFPLRLVVTQTVEPRKAKPGDKVPFVLFSDFYYRDLLLAERGTAVTGMVKKSQRPGAFGKGSHLEIQLESLKMRDGREISLRGSAEAKGGTDFPVALQATEAIFGTVLFPPALAVSAVLFAVPGKSEPLPEGSLVIAYVDRDTPLDAGLMSGYRTLAPAATARVIRGGKHWARAADLFCNGIPIGHLRKSRLLELRLEPGWYRFSIRPERPTAIYAVPGRTYILLADDRDITVSEPNEVNQNTMGRMPSRWQRTLGEMLADSKPTDISDIYSAGCTPLKEEFSIASKP